MSLNDQTTSIGELRDKVRRFIQSRDWDQFHTPKDLSIGLITEASELLECFRFRSNAEVARLLQDDEDFRRALRHELADSLFFVLALSRKLDIDLSQALAEKMALSAQRYPVELVRGKNDKYTAYRQGEGGQGDRGAR